MVWSLTGIPGVPGSSTGAVWVCVAVRTRCSTSIEWSFFNTASLIACTNPSGNCRRSSETKVVCASPDRRATTFAVNGVSGVVESRRPNCPHRATALFGVMSTDAAPTWRSATHGEAGTTRPTKSPPKSIVEKVREFTAFHCRFLFGSTGAEIGIQKIVAFTRRKMRTASSLARLTKCPGGRCGGAEANKRLGCAPRLFRFPPLARYL